MPALAPVLRPLELVETAVGPVEVALAGAAVELVVNATTVDDVKAVVVDDEVDEEEDVEEVDEEDDEEEEEATTFDLRTNPGLES